LGEGKKGMKRIQVKVKQSGMWKVFPVGKKVFWWRARPKKKKGGEGIMGVRSNWGKPPERGYFNAKIVPAGKVTGGGVSENEKSDGA